MTQTLTFALPKGGEREMVVRYALNAGYAGRDADQVRRAVHLESVGEAW